MSTHKILSALLVALILAGGCANSDDFKEAIVLGGQEVQPEVLNLGHDTYIAYCRACHGVNGDGKGPASKGLRPPPRDFRQGVFKFANVETGYLPRDEDLQRIVRHGLGGTAMLPWDISDDRLDAVIQYIKTFSELWVDEFEEVGEEIVAGTDPFGAARRDEAVEMGKKLYHALAQCNSCHPSYISYQEIYDAGVEMTGSGNTDLGPHSYAVELKDSDYDSKLLPPDFTFHLVRSGESTEAIFLAIASGIGGTAMPTWKGSLPDDQIWAMAYYVRSLIEIRDTSEALALKQRLRNQPAWVAPADTDGGR